MKLCADHVTDWPILLKQKIFKLKNFSHDQYICFVVKS